MRSQRSNKQSLFLDKFVSVVKMKNQNILSKNNRKTLME